MNAQTVRRFIILPFALLLSVGGLVWQWGPLPTHDGHVFMASAATLRDLRDASAQHKSRFYEINDDARLNTLGQEAASVALGYLSADDVERLIQVILALGAAAGVITNGMLRGRDDAWAGVILLPLGLDASLYLGLYNSKGALILSLILVAAIVEMRSPQWRVMPVLAVVSIATVLLHPVSWLFAACVGGAVVCARVLNQRQEAAPRQTRRHMGVLCALLVPSGVVAFALRPPRPTGPLAYGAEVSYRFFALGTGEGLAQVSLWPDLVGRSYLFVLAVSIMTMLAANVRASGLRPAIDDGWCTAFVAAAMLAIVVPDEAAGGWTHFLRAAAFVLLVLAAWVAARWSVIARPARSAVAVVTAFCLSAKLLGAYALQHDARSHRQALRQVSRLMKDGCTIAPLVAPDALPVSSISGVRYRVQPLYQATSRLELDKDVAVLFNFNYRLNVYPVRWREGLEVQEGLWRWKPREKATDVDTIDLAGYQGRTGEVINYLLVVGRDDQLVPGVRFAINGSKVVAQFGGDSLPPIVRLFELAPCE